MLPSLPSCMPLTLSLSLSVGKCWALGAQRGTRTSHLCPGLGGGAAEWEACIPAAGDRCPLAVSHVHRGTARTAPTYLRGWVPQGTARNPAPASDPLSWDLRVGLRGPRREQSSRAAPGVPDVCREWRGHGTVRCWLLNLERLLLHPSGELWACSGLVRAPSASRW